MPVTVALSTSRAIRAIVTSGLAVILAAVTVVAAILIITTTVAIIIAPIFTTVIIVVGPFSFFGVGISVCYLYQFADGCGPLAVQLVMELLVSEPFGESGDGLGVSDVRNGISCLREAPDEVA